MELILLKRRKPFVIGTLTLICLLAGFFILAEHIGMDKAATIISVVGAFITAVAFWIQYYHNGQVEEAKLVMELNQQFISNEKLSSVEHDLEQYNALDMQKDQSKEEIEKEKKEYEKFLCEKYRIDGPDRQNLVNYLVHLEGIASLVNTGVLRLETITDLMAYRYFIAVNNPIVKELELKPYAAFYQGIYMIYDSWAEIVGDAMPLKARCND